MRKVFFICFVGLAAASASAIVVEDYTVAEAAPSDLDWGGVYNYKNSSAVAVDPYWILTAAHVADDGGSGALTIDDIVYTQQEIVYHTDASADLALVRYDKILPGKYYDLYTGDLPLTFEEDPLPVLMVGYGNTGVVFDDYWTNNAPTASSRETKRWGSQEIDIALDDEFWMYFDKGQTDYEAGAGVGDSGGGVFYKEGTNGWKLAGINVALKEKPGTSGLGFNRTVAVSMPYYADWVMDTMDTVPEPAAMGLMGIGTIGLFLARTKRRRNIAGRSVFPIRGDEPMCDRFDAVEGSENPEKRGYTDYLAGMLEMIRTSPLSVWMNTLHTRYNALNKTLWHLIIVTMERSTERKTTVREQSKIALVTSLDAFLEGISWDRMVTSVKSARTKSNQAVKIKTRKSLDVLLEMLPWDQMVSAYRRFKRLFRFYRS